MKKQIFVGSSFLTRLGLFFNRQACLRFNENSYLNPTWYISLLIGVSLIWLLVTPTASADAGPHPSMKFTLEYVVDQVAIKNSQLIECADAACTRGNQPGQFGECTSTGCWAKWYGDGPFKLVIEFADRTRESNVFESRAFNDNLRVTVLDSSLQVESLA